MNSIAMGPASYSGVDYKVCVATVNLLASRFIHRGASPLSLVSFVKGPSFSYWLSVSWPYWTTHTFGGLLEGFTDFSVILSYSQFRFIREAQ